MTGLYTPATGLMIYIYIYMYIINHTSNTNNTNNHIVCITCIRVHVYIHGNCLPEEPAAQQYLRSVPSHPDGAAEKEAANGGLGKVGCPAVYIYIYIYIIIYIYIYNHIYIYIYIYIYINGLCTNQIQTY